ncbi:hypothetical protein GCM10022198_13960 [Klugiella xanthotipulae]|uniref:PfkB family carbohydrate kinase n=1 Tax=Klugiella xanthotipulae TaxID=244735 RepID=UPI001153ADAF|nr:PfkB family carbohydrate kinase [Klugiella xanthotipulae]
MINRVVVVGDALIDELVTERETTSVPGGAALNVAVGLSRLGVPASLIAAVGQDADGDALRLFLSHHGVSLLASPSPLGTSRAVSTRVGGEPTYTFNEAARNRHLRLYEREVHALAVAPAVLVSGFPLDDAEETDRLVAAITHPESRLLLDANPRSGMLRDRAAFVAGWERVAGMSALVKVGEDDAELLYGRPLDDVVQRLLDAGVGAVLATAGAAGASVYTSAGVSVHREVAPLHGPVVDTMGAGDATFAAVAAGILHRWPETDAEWGTLLDRAMGIAAATVRHPGAMLRFATEVGSVGVAETTTARRPRG